MLPAKDLDTSKLVDAINEEHRNCERAVNAALDHAFRAGALLIEAKDRCPHGTWEAWLAENFEGSPRTAQVYTRIANNREQVEAAKAQSSAPLSLAGALRALAGPDPDGFPPEEAAILKRALDTCEFFPNPSPERLVELSEEVRRGFVAEVAWSAMMEQGQNYVIIKDTVEEDIDNLTPEIIAQLHEQAQELRWWVEQMEWLDTLVRARDWPPGSGMPTAAFDEKQRDLTLSELYDTEIGLPSPRDSIREFCGNVV